MDLLQQHLETVKTRIQGQGLSALEMMDEVSSRQAKLSDAVSDTRDRLKAEILLLNGMISEVKGPGPTIEERIATMREAGQKDSADSLQHTLNIQKKAEDIERLRDEIENTAQWGRSHKEAALQEAVDALQAMERSHPVFDRIAAGKAVIQQGEELRAAAVALEGSGDPGAARRMNSMLDESEATINRGRAIVNGQESA